MQTFFAFSELGRPLLFSAWNTINSSMALLAVFGLVAALLIHFAIRPRKWARRTRSFLASYKNWVSPVLRTLSGLFLFSASFSRFLFAPNLSTAFLPPVVERVLLAVQLLVALAFLIGVFPRFMSLLGFTLYFFALFIFPLNSILSYFAVVGIFAYIFIIGDAGLPKRRGKPIFPNVIAIFNLHGLKPYAMALLRFATAVAFIISGFFYKIYGPVYALEFVRIQGINFLPGFGFVNFTNEMFILSVGITEILFGALLILGLLPRFIGGFLIVLFTLVVAWIGVYALISYLPFYAAAFALLVQGGGERWSAELVNKRVLALVPAKKKQRKSNK